MRVLQRAAQTLGDERALARYLHVPMPELFLWLRGDEEPPHTVFLRAVDLITEAMPAGDELPPPAGTNTEKKRPAGPS
jgi:hypothetical protein